MSDVQDVPEEWLHYAKVNLEYAKADAYHQALRDEEIRMMIAEGIRHRRLIFRARQKCNQMLVRVVRCLRRAASGF